jgi:hypothetical protein
VLPLPRERNKGSVRRRPQTAVTFPMSAPSVARATIVFKLN